MSRDEIAAPPTMPAGQSLAASGLLDECNDLLSTLTDDQRRAVISSLSSGWLEGWRPTRRDVEQLVDVARR